MRRGSRGVRPAGCRGAPRLLCLGDPYLYDAVSAMLVPARLAAHAVRASQRSDATHKSTDAHRDRLGVVFDVPKRSTHLAATDH